MATRYSITQNAIGINTPMIAWFREAYPDVKYVRCCVRSDSSSDYEPPQPVLRIRNRKQHQPGDGNYFCSHVYSAKALAGWYLNGTLYLTNCAAVYWWDSTTYCSYYQVSAGGRWVYTGSITFNSVRRYWSCTKTVYHHTSYLPNGRAVFTVATGTRRFDYYPSDPAAEFAATAVENSSTFTYTLLRSFGEANITPPTFEDRGMQSQIDSDTVPNLSSYLNAAYIAAFESLPQVRTNNIANLVSLWSALSSLLRSFRRGDLGLTEVGSLSDLWLEYRYVFNTTKSDINDIVLYVERLRNIRSLPNITGHGAFGYETSQGDRYIIRCSLETNTQDYLGIYSLAEQMGVALDGYNAWDLIPYSFIVDWFLKIGDMLEVARSRNYALRIRPSAVWFSVTHEFENVYGQHQCDYYRWAGSDLSFMSTLPATMLQQRQAKTSTWVKRGADALALLS